MDLYCNVAQARLLPRARLMKNTMNQKSSVEEIRQRFDLDVERFSNLETGQSATMDAPLVLELIVQAAKATTPHAKRVLDVGCGAGNYSLKLLEQLPNLGFDLVDLSRPMLERATQRLSAQTSGAIVAHQSDIRVLELEDNSFDIITAAAVLHHLRDDHEWREVFQKFYRVLKPGGSLWISDLVTQSIESVHAMMWARYGDYLRDMKDDEYRAEVFAYIDREDTPRPLLWQIDLLRQAGFSQVEILHKNSVFAAFGAVRS